MKKILSICFSLWFYIGYAQENKIPEARAGVHYGQELTAADAVSMRELQEKLKADNLYQGKISGKVVAVCKVKGCFMQLDRGNGQAPVMVRFKDYAFFMPQNIVGKNVVINGEAKVKETSVEQLQHWAKDEGKSASEIAMINKPKQDIEVIADGVLVMR